MPRVSRRDRRIRAAFKRRVQLYVPEPVPFAEPWGDDDCEIVFDDDTPTEEAQHEHA